jgi:DNA-directed RNA polymerase specialized sigma24 family protein
MSNASPPIGPDLRNALVAMVKKRVPESEVEDIVQSTLADAFASPHAPDDAESFRRWIFGVAKNKVVDYHRRAGRETFDVPEVAGHAAPHQEADLLRWAEKHLPPGEENKATLEWMLREGDGEKLESIAETEHLPAPRVRQRVSRLRRHLKAHWQKEVAVLAALGVLITGLYLFLKRPQPGMPIANEDVARAEEMRKQAFEKCLAKEWNDCVHELDAAKELDPAGDTAPTVQQARQNAAKAQSKDLALPPTAPTVSVIHDNDTPPPLESAPPPVMPAPTGSDYYPIPTAMPKSSGPTKGCFDWAPAPAPAPKPQGKIQGKKAAPSGKPAPKSATSELSGSDWGSNNIGKSGFKVPNAPSKDLLLGDETATKKKRP